MKSIFTGALIGDEHTLRDWGAIITNSDVIGMPEPNTVLLEVPGRSGRLDLSEGSPDEQGPLGRDLFSYFQ